MKILKVDFQSGDAPGLFAKSLRETGFGVITNHPISAEKINQVYQDWQRFFVSEERYHYLIDRDTHEGYIPLASSETAKGYSVKDIKEFYHFYPWGRYPTMLSTATREMYTELSNLAGTLLQWIEDETPADIAKHFSMPLSDMIKDSKRTMLRIIHYPPLTGNEPKGAVRAAAHSDINLITLLPAATVGGLEVLGKSNHWYMVPCDPGTIIVNIADMLEECTQGYYHSTLHRVVNPVGEEARKARLSMPLFLHARPEVRLSDKYTAQEFWLERMKELGLK